MLKLRRIKTSVYETLDGRFTIMKDPTSGSEMMGWGFTSWLIFDNTDSAEDAAILFDIHYPTLRDAREELEHNAYAEPRG